MKLLPSRIVLPFITATFAVCFIATSEEVAPNTKAIQPPKIDIKSVSEMTVGKLTYVSLTLQVTNPNSLPIIYTGYAPNSFAPSMPVDRIAPMYQVAMWKDGKWVPHPIGRCGTGVTDLPLHPGKNVTFDVAVPKGDWQMIKVEFGQMAGWTKGVTTSTTWGVVVTRDERGELTIL